MKQIILAPYVFTEIRDKHVLYYNSLNGEKIITSDNKIIKTFSRRENNYNIIKIEENLLHLDWVKSFIDEVEQKKIGIIVSYDKVAPIQFAPVISIQNEYGQKKVSKDNSYNSFLNLRELTIVLNAKYSYEDLKQNRKGNSNLLLESETYSVDYQLINNFIDPLYLSESVHRINLNGYNILEYKHFDDLIAMLYKFFNRTQICFNFNTLDVLNDLNKLIALMELPKSKFIFNLRDENHKSHMNTINRYLSGKNIEFNCYIENIDEAEKYNDLQIENRKINYIPSYNGSNLDFFEENVFLNKNDVLSFKPTQNEVFKNMNINSKYFGKLIINAIGDVYANMLQDSLGNISTNSIQEILDAEFQNGNSWFLTRSKVSPCNKCIFNILCPPISSYEFELKRYNLCHIN